MTDGQRWTCIVRCADCGHELNRAEWVPEKGDLRIALGAPLMAGKCPKGCRATLSDCNMNINLDWSEEAETTA